MPPKKTAVRPPAKKKKPRIVVQTPKGTMVSVLRLLWCHSVERNAALKRDNRTCQFVGCNKKASVAKDKGCKVEVHHLAEGDINWDRIERVLRAELFCSPDMLITLCKEHHKQVHDMGEL